MSISLTSVQNLLNITREETRPYLWLRMNGGGNRPNALKGKKKTPGEAIVASAIGEADRFDILFFSLINYGRQAGWKWIPASNTSNPSDALDGTVAPVMGECRLFCAMLEVLATAPPSCGLGITPGLVVVTSRYVGRYGAGFISAGSKIQNAIDAGFTGNIEDPRNGTLDGSMLWENHVVVQYNGRIFDPSYGEELATIDDGVVYDVELRGIVLSGETYCRARKRATNEVHFFKKSPIDMTYQGNSIGNRWLGPYESDEIPDR